MSWSSWAWLARTPPGSRARQLIDDLLVEPPSVLGRTRVRDFWDTHGLHALADAVRAAHDVGAAVNFRQM